MKLLIYTAAGLSLAQAASQTPSISEVKAAGSQPIGTHTAQICEATDWKYGETNEKSKTFIPPKDGESGDTDYPFGKMKVLFTVGEYDPETGYVIPGVPDGMGAYLPDASTVRIVVQSESYGSISQQESYPYIVNENGASFTGSHIMYVDYDREKLAKFMDNDNAASSMVKGGGNLVQNVYNLKGDLVSKRPDSGCADAPHYSNTDEYGCGTWNEIMADPAPSQADWVMQSLCAAHLEEKHQWGQNLGLEDDIFITNEEWTDFKAGSNYTGIPAHALELATGDLYAVGAFTLGGFEKIVEFNCGVPGYVCFSPSGYNGAFGDVHADASRKNALGKRPDGTDYVFPQNIVPARIYVGVKGLNAKGEPANDFLSRNGLAYGKVYGFGVDMSSNGPTGGEWRDAFHKKESNVRKAVNGAFYAIDWQWDGEVRQFVYDGSWDFQHKPAGASSIEFWTGKGPNAGAAKTEHNSPDPYGGQRFMQTSTAGYYGIYDATGLKAALEAMGNSKELPDMVAANYFALEGEIDITAQIELGNKGKKANGDDQTTNSDNYNAADGVDSAKKTFEDIDGFEWIASKDSDDGFVVIQEDSGNDFGERTFFSKVDKTAPMTYYFIAMSGGDDNTRMGTYNVGVPKGTNQVTGAHEFSGVIDLSGLLQKKSGEFTAKAGDGYSVLQAAANVDFDDKIIAMGLQAHNLEAGIIEELALDRGGQLLAFQPQFEKKKSGWARRFSLWLWIMQFFGYFNW